MARISSGAASEENVLIRAGIFSLTILPRLGGKIASLRVGDRELLQAPLAAYISRTRTMPFDASDASGWDECLPSIAACTLQTVAGAASIPDHGDLWRVTWQPRAATAGSATFRAECFSMPLRLERTMTLTESDGVWRLSLGYTVTNTGRISMPWLWAAHPLFAAEEGDRILLPGSIHKLRLQGSRDSRLGEIGSQVSWPMARLANGCRIDLSAVQPQQSGIAGKLFAGPLSTSENWCALERPKAGVRIKASFDTSATPYLGLWICYGGWPERPGPKQMCVALEPATAPVDSLAQTGPWSRVLAPGESFSWPMVVEIESIPSVT